MSDYPVVNFLIKAIPFGYFSHRIGSSARKDHNFGSTRSTVKVVIVSTAQAFGAKIGYDTGVAAADIFKPHFDEFSCGVIGGLLIGYGAGVVVSETCEGFFHAINYEIDRRVCTECRQHYINRFYEGEEKTMCTDCDTIMTVLRTDLRLYQQQNQ